MAGNHMTVARGLNWIVATGLILSLAAPARSQDAPAEPLDSIGDAKWSDNIGLIRRTSEAVEEQAVPDDPRRIEELAQAEAEVQAAVAAGLMTPEEAERILAELGGGAAGRRGGPGAASGPAAQKMTVPLIAGSDVGYAVKVAGPLVAADQVGGRGAGPSTWGVVAGLRLRGESPRTLTSLLVPWGHGTLWVGGHPELESMVVGGDVRVGLDAHIMRWHWLGIGPLIEYRMAKYIQFDKTDFEFFGHGMGFGGHVIFRTTEGPDAPPLFFADVAIVERLAFDDAGGSSAYLDALLGVGRRVRFLAFVDAPMGGDHYQGVRVGLGVGGYY
jgi:hypothetical protein